MDFPSNTLSRSEVDPNGACANNLRAAEPFPTSPGSQRPLRRFPRRLETPNRLAIERAKLLLSRLRWKHCHSARREPRPPALSREKFRELIRVDFLCSAPMRRRPLFL